jgi:2-polyprenyl-3-methyl-5-hydroxy-6-metoxy-1,4-benzoquinol methylase
MSRRIPKELFKGEHFLGRPADADDRIVQRRIKLVKDFPGFTGKDKTLLDIGCGNGASVFALQSEFKSCLGIDVEFRPENKGSCRFLLGDITNFRPEEEFDRIISFEVIEHLQTEDLGNYYLSLKPGGLMAVTVPNKWWIFETHGATVRGLNWIPWNRVPMFSWLPERIHDKYANARIYSMRSIKKLLKEQGFKILEAKYVTAPMDVIPEGKLKNFVIKYIFNTDTTRIPFKATSILIVAQRS